jgi:HEAT repeat protein
LRLEDLLVELLSGDDGRAEAAVEGIVAQLEAQPSQALPALQEVLGAPQADHRWWAARALAAISHPQVSPLLLKALGDPDASVRQCAALGLRLHPYPQAIPALIDALDDQDRLVATLAAGALVRLGEAAVPALLEVMQSDSQPARLEAARALAEIGDLRAVPALFAALDEGSALMEYWASEGLERMGVGMVYFKPG